MANNELTITFGAGADGRSVTRKFNRPEDIYEFFMSRVAPQSSGASSVQQSMLLSSAIPPAKPTRNEYVGMTQAPTPKEVEPAADLQMSNILREDTVFDGTCNYYGYGTFVGKCKVSADRSTVVPAGRGRFDVNTFRVPNPIVKFTSIEGIFDAKSVQQAVVNFKRGNDLYTYNGSLLGLALDQGTLTNETLEVDFVGKFEGVNFQKGVITGPTWSIRGENLNIPYYEVNDGNSVLAIGGRNSNVVYERRSSNGTIEISFKTDADGNRERFIERTPEYTYTGDGHLELDDDNVIVVWNGDGVLTYVNTGRTLTGTFADGEFNRGTLAYAHSSMRIPVRAVIDANINGDDDTVLAIDDTFNLAHP